MSEFNGTAITVSHCINEVNLRNRWQDQDDFSIRLSRNILKTLPTNENQLLESMRRVKTIFFRINRISKSYYANYVWAYLSDVLPSEVPAVDNVSLIVSDQSLFNQILRILTEYKNEVESTRLWQPFWNENPMKPKKETHLQPTIFSQLRHRFRHIGVEFLKEPDDGAGPLDFRCTATYDNKIFNCCIEFKTAQHRDLEHKIENQLPGYMNAAQTLFGVFLVFWFKDNKAYHLPKKYCDPDDLQNSLINSIINDTSRKIEVITIDVTRKPSASRL